MFGGTPISYHKSGAGYKSPRSVAATQYRTLASAYALYQKPTPLEVYEHWLTDDERAKLSPAAILALQCGSIADIYVDELRRLLGARFL